MTEDELVEAAARAIYEVYCERLDPVPKCLTWHEIDEEYREDHRADARAAIAVLRPLIRAEALEEAATELVRLGVHGGAAAIRAMIPGEKE